MMKKMLRAAALLLIPVLLAGCGMNAFQTGGAISAASIKSVDLDPNHPVTVTVWHYYNGIQQAEFTRFVSEFNSTEGAEQGIHVEEHSIGSVEDLNSNVLAAARKDVGADELPSIFAAYSDVAFAVDQLGQVADIEPYFSQDELAEYVPGYLEEGSFAGDGTLKIFPTAKSTEIMMMNRTNWDLFAQATGTELSSLSTIEGVTKTAQKYYEWTDSLTPEVSNDGKAMFGRDAFANYMLIGAQQLGTEIFAVNDGVCTLNFDKETMRRLWDNYYVPMVAGWFAENNHFRSDDIKTGSIICCVGSTASAAYFPESVLLSDTESYNIELTVMPAPEFEGAKPYAVQQGAGMVVSKGGDKEIYASTVFLKWFTEAQRNATFAVLSGYLPVTEQANNTDVLEQAIAENNVGDNSRAVLEAGLETVQTNTMYTSLPFANGMGARSILETTMPERAAVDRAAFLEQLSMGIPYEEALAQFNNDDTFNDWYEDTLTQLEAVLEV